jgi:hypothetical protein
MVSISDLGNGRKVDAVIGGLTPDEQSVLNAEYATQARAAAALQGILDQDAQRAAVLSGKIPTKLDRRPEGWETKILNIEPSPAIAIMREQLAHSRRVSNESARPWWKKSGAWSLIISFIGLVIAAIAAWPDIKSWGVAIWSIVTPLASQ